MTLIRDPFEPRNPDFEARVRDSFDRQPFMTHCGITLTIVEPGFVEMRCPRRHELTQQHGFLHGGLVGTLADCAAGYAAFSLMRAQDTVLTIEYKVNMMAPAAGAEVIAQAAVRRAGGSIMVVQAEVTTLIDGAEKRCATALATMLVKKDTPDAPPT